MTLVSKICLFCEELINSENKSIEHVIPKWLLELLQIKDLEIEPSHITPEENLVSKRKHNLESLKAGNICRDCNNGWMSKLENEAKPIIEDLISLKRLCIDLNDQERLILARWTTKTAYTLNAGSNYHKNIPPEHYSYLYKNKNLLPANVWSFAQQHHASQAFYWLQWPAWALNNVEENHAEIEQLKTQAYKISFQFSNLLLTVFYLPLNEYIPVLWKGIHIPMYPKTGKCGWYEKEKFPWDNSVNAVTKFHLGVEAWRQ